jgi:hypothetical protein
MIESYKSYLLDTSANELKREAENILSHDKDEELTWWYKFDRKPQNIIEDFIYQSARQHNVYHSYAGAEWWIRSHDSISSSWYFHVDGDVDRFRKDGKYVAAPFSTVTYLTDCGQPTVLLDQYHDWTKEDGLYMIGENDWTFWSSPKAGKQICWSMPYFHGVPANYGDMEEGEKRITLMFNVWKEKPYAPACVEYNLPYEISQGIVTLTPKKDSFLEEKKPHGFFNILAEGVEMQVQYHGYNEQGASWIVTQFLPSGLEELEDQHFPILRLQPD